MSDQQASPSHRHPLRIVTATALFDGHDAAINVFRRLMLAKGMEVIHLGHSRSVAEIVDAVIQEDAQAVAVSSYQGGHVEFFRYLVDRLNELNAGYVRIFGGGGGVFLGDEIDALKRYGVADIFTPEDGARLGLQGIVERIITIIGQAETPPMPDGAVVADALGPSDKGALARMITMFERTGDTSQTGAWHEALAKKIGRTNGTCHRCHRRRRGRQILADR